MKKLSVGFTLVEVLAVLIIAGIFASLAFPRLISQQEKAHVAEAVNNMSSLRKALLAYYDVNRCKPRPPLVTPATCTNPLDAWNWPSGTLVATTNAANSFNRTLGVDIEPSKHGWNITSTGHLITATKHGVVGNFIRLNVWTGNWTAGGDFDFTSGKYRVKLNR